MKRTTLEIQGQTVEVQDLRVQGNTCHFTYQGKSYQYESLSLSSEQLTLRNEHQQVNFRFKAKPSYKSIVGPQGQLKIQSAQEKSSKPSQQTSPLVKADYPGTTLDIFVQVGQRVQAGEPLIKMESMKLERQIPAPCSGKVKSIDIQVGDVLKSGQTLITLEEDPS